METNNVVIRPLTEIAEFEELTRVERQIRRYSDLDTMPVRVYAANTKVLGGQLFAAFDGHRMVGYCLSLPGFGPDGERFLYGFGIAVMPEYRDAGIGRRLKFAQREDALRRGIRRMVWVFDPLQLKNAYFNMEVLGAVVRRFAVNYFGVSSLPDSGGLPSNLCVAEWEMDGERACAAVCGQRSPRPPAEETIEVPTGITEIVRRNGRVARDTQLRVTAQFLRYFNAGFTVTGFEKTPDAGVYLLARERQLAAVSGHGQLVLSAES